MGFVYKREAPANGSRTKWPKGSWEARWREFDPDKGKLSWRGRRFGTKREADAFLSSVETDMNRGEHIPTKLANIRFSEIAEAWLKNLDGLEPTTIHTYESALRNHVLPTFSERAVGSITYKDIINWVASKKATSNPATVRGAYRVLRLILAEGVRYGCLRANPATGVSLPSVPKREELLILDRRQVDQLANRVNDLWLAGQESRIGRLPTLPVPSTLPYGLIVRFAAFTGLRAGEIAGLSIRNLDLKAKTVTVNSKVADVDGHLITGAPKTKAGRRSVPLPGFLVAPLRSYLGERRANPNGLVFIGSEGKAWRHRNYNTRYFRPAVRSLVNDGTFSMELEALRFHDLRHTYASYLVEIGAHPKEMSELLGHSTVSITLDVYSHLFPHLRASLGERLDAAYRADHPDEPEADVIPFA